VRLRTPLVIAALIVLVLGAAILRLSPLWPGPSEPAGATRLGMMTAAPHVVPNMGCPAALLTPAVVATVRDDLVLLSVDSGELVPVVWPSGWAAWRIDGRAQIVGRDGSIVAREGDVLDDLGGGMGDDNVFNICLIGG
jgi:hypothetical protein